MTIAGMFMDSIQETLFSCVPNDLRLEIGAGGIGQRLGVFFQTHGHLKTPDVLDLATVIEIDLRHE